MEGTSDELRRQKAKNLRYKKAIVRGMSLGSITEELWGMQEVCQDVRWFEDDEDSLVSALDGDEDEAWEFKMAFADLCAELDQFTEDLEEAYVPDCFDDLFPAVGAGDYMGGMLGYDAYDGDYFGLDPYQYGLAQEESAKRITRLTKKELLEATGACLKVAVSYLGILYRYDCLEASLKILQGKNMELLRLFKAIEEQYDKAEESSHHFELKYGADVAKLDAMLDEVPQEYWIQ